MARVPLTDLPSGSTLTVYRRTTDDKWPGRPTARADIHCIWKGHDPDPKVVKTGTGGMRDELDTRMVTQ